MGRPVPALKQLVKEVQEIDPKITVEISNVEDGLGRLRTVTFFPEPWLHIALAQIARSDQRFGLRYGDGITITFVSDTRADFATPYGLVEHKAYADALIEREAERKKEQRAAKRAAKKAAPPTSKSE
jgi:hypothetical protein